MPHITNSKTVSIMADVRHSGTFTLMYKGGATESGYGYVAMTFRGVTLVFKPDVTVAEAIEMLALNGEGGVSGEKIRAAWDAND